MNILLITHTFSDKIIGGEARISWELAQALAQKNINVYVVSPFVEKGIKSFLPDNLKVYQVPFCHPAAGLDNSNMLRLFFYSLPLLFIKKINIIHLVSSNGPCFFSRFKFGRIFIESADLQHDYNNPKISAELWHDRERKNNAEKIDYQPNLFEKIFDKFTALFYNIFRLDQVYPREVDVYLCRAKFLMKFFQDNHYLAKTYYLPNGVNPEEFKPTDKMKKDEQVTFLFVGKLTKSKGLLYLIEAFKRLKKEQPKIRLLLIGSGATETETEIRKAAEGIDDITFLGSQPPAEIKKYYHEADIFVMPSLSEGFGIANVEAMASGLAVISTKVGGIVDVVVDNETGFLVEPADSDALYQAMKKLADNPELVKQFGKRGRVRAEKLFSWSVIADNLINIYQSCLK